MALCVAYWSTGTVTGNNWLLAIILLVTASKATTGHCQAGDWSQATTGHLQLVTASQATTTGHCQAGDWSQATTGHW